MEDEPIHPLRRFRRDHLKITQRAMASQIGESEFRVCRIENGKQPADLTFIRKVAALSGDERARVELARALLGNAA